ncbi:MAG: primosomal protein N' [Candidatus Fermentibacter sp.]|nr:primosomal protein N' [Candidatus Fermentibacter sp.]
MPDATAVEVAVPRPVWRTFTYLLPSGMAGGVLEGCRVEVPFGREKLTGWIWGRSTSLPADGVKTVESRLDCVSALPRPVLELARWAADYYSAPPGMMMASASPPGAGAGLRREVRRTAGRAAAGDPVLEGLDGSAFVPVDGLAHGFSSRSVLMSHLSSLASSGAVECRLSPAPARRTSAGMAVAPCLPPAELAGMAERLRRKAPAQASILEILSRSDERITVSSLLREAGASRASLDAVVKAGAAAVSPAEAAGTGVSLAGAEVAELEPGQLEAVSRISGAKGGVFLLHGVTGSGKTEVYLRAIAGVVARGLQAVVLVPEISLTPQLTARFERRFPGMVAVMHSALSTGERLRAWSALAAGEKCIAIGPRSAVFAPLARTGIIIVDEEHDSSYKQQEQPRYNARDLAVVRGFLEGVPVVLGSATPSLESRGNADSGKYEILTLPGRAGGRPMPSVKPVRPGDYGSVVPPEMLTAVSDAWHRGEQSILLLNRRGFAPTRICAGCGRREDCPECAVAPTYHARGGILRCHHCGWWTMAPRDCPSCGCTRFVTEGPGVQRVEAFLAGALPGIRILRLDRDTSSSAGATWEILGRFAEGGADVLLGTQMVAKGHDFPGVTLVGILSADMALAIPDFRASERAFQLVMQAAGRAGRGSIPGIVLVETLRPETLAAAIAQDYGAFLESELPARKLLGYPPYGRIVRFVWSGPVEARVAAAAKSCMDALEPPPGARVFPPAPAILPRLRGKWRYSALARSDSRAALRRLVQDALASFEAAGSKGVMFDVDVDPTDLL